MRIVLLTAVLAACSHTPPSASTAADPLRADLDMFCGPESAAKATSMPEFGAYVESKATSPELKEALDQLKRDMISVRGFETKMRAMLAKAHVDACPTLDKLMSPKPAG
jgi:hypothetical protein